MAWKRVGESQIYHKVKSNAIFRYEMSLRVPYFPYSTSLEIALTCTENFP